MREHALPNCCPYCGREHDLATNTTSGTRPKDGDYSLCIQCGHFGIFDRKAQGGVRRATAAEAVCIAASPEASKVQLAWRMMDQKRRAAAQGGHHG